MSGTLKPESRTHYALSHPRPIITARCPACNRDFVMLTEDDSSICPCGSTIARKENEQWKLFCSAEKQPFLDNG